MNSITPDPSALVELPFLPVLHQRPFQSPQLRIPPSHRLNPEKKYIVESMSGGAGLIDCDNDGKLDIITVNGSTIDRYRQGGDPMITLTYHQDANFKFTDITSAAGLTRKGWGMGVAVADFDNDGLPDIYVTGFGGNALYRNLGNCKFARCHRKSRSRRRRLQHRRGLGRLRSRWICRLVRCALCSFRYGPSADFRQ